MQKASQSAFDLSKIFEAEDDDEIKVAKIGQLAGTILDFDVREEFKFTFILYFVRRGNLSMVIKLQRIIYRDISALLKEQWPTIDF